MKLHQFGVAFAGCFLLYGCSTLTPTQLPSDLNKSLEISESSALVRGENLANAVYILIKKVEKLEEGLLFASKSSNTSSLGVTKLNEAISALKMQISDINSTVNMQTIEIENTKKRLVNETPVISKTETNSSAAIKSGDETQIDYKDKVVEITVKKTQLLKLPEENSKKIKNAYRGERFYFDGLTNGFYHLSKQNAYVNANDITVKPSKKVANIEAKAKTTKVFRKKKIKEIVIDNSFTNSGKQNSSNAADDYLLKEQNATHNKEGKVANKEWIKGGEAAKEIGGSLSANKNINDSNVKQQCAAELLKKGIQISGRQSIVDACVASWKLIVKGQK